MANTIDSSLQLTEILDSALTAFKRAVVPLNAFSTVYADVALQGDDTVDVPYYPLATDASASRNADGSYKALVTDTDTQVKTITIDTNKVQGLSFTGRERARQPVFDPEKHGMIKGEKLGYDIVADVLSVVTAANFAGSTIAASAAADFDEEDVADLAQLCDEAEWSSIGRSLILNPAFHYNLVKQPAILDRSQSGSNSLNTGDLPNIMGFTLFCSNGVPANGAENIAGFAVTDSAILCAFAPVPPSDGVRQLLVDYQQVTDPDTGATLEYKRIAYPDTDEEAQFIEAHYGYAVGEAAALKRVTTT